MKIPHLSLLAGGAFAVLLPLAPLCAQSQPVPASKDATKVEEKVAKMKGNLSLTDEQVTAVKAIFDEQKTKADAIRADTTLSKDQMREKMKPVMDETKMKIEALLTPEQKAKAAQLKKERSEKRKAEKAQ